MYMPDMIKNYDPSKLTELAVVLRLVLACVFGGVLGIERTLKGRAAGFRTYMLVCMGATVVMMTGQFVMQNIGDSDPTRLGAQVISGIGFLGAGTIMVTGQHKIKGLTTAAGLWSAACMGIALGAGFYLGAIVMCVMVLIVMSLFDRVQTRYISRSKSIRLYVVFENFQNLVAFLDFLKEQNILVSDFETNAPEMGVGVGAFFNVHFKVKKSHAEIIDLVRHCEGLMFIEEI